MVYAIIQMFVDFPYDPMHRILTDISLATAALVCGVIWVADKGEEEG